MTRPVGPGFGNNNPPPPGGRGTPQYPIPPHLQPNKPAAPPTPQPLIPPKAIYPNRFLAGLTPPQIKVIAENWGKTPERKEGEYFLRESSTVKDSFRLIVFHDKKVQVFTVDKNNITKLENDEKTPLPRESFDEIKKILQSKYNITLTESKLPDPPVNFRRAVNDEPVVAAAVKAFNPPPPAAAAQSSLFPPAAFLGIDQLEGKTIGETIIEWSIQGRSSGDYFVVELPVISRPPTISQTFKLFAIDSQNRLTEFTIVNTGSKSIVIKDDSVCELVSPTLHTLSSFLEVPLLTPKAPVGRVLDKPEEPSILETMGGRTRASNDFMVGVPGYKNGTLTYNGVTYLPVVSGRLKYDSPLVSLGSSELREMLTFRRTDALVEYAKEFARVRSPDVLTTLKNLITFMNQKLPIGPNLVRRIDQFNASWLAAGADSVKRRGVDIPIISIEDYIDAGLGVCRQRVLIGGFLLDEASELNPEIKSIYSVRDQTPSGVHVWLVVKSQENKLYLCDPMWEVARALDETTINELALLGYGREALERSIRIATE